MPVSLNQEAFRHAKALIKSGDVVHDERDDWSDHAPSPKQENSYIDAHGIEDFGRWHLGVDRGENEGTKQRFGFPFGDLKKVHGCAVISLESRAAQYHHASIARAAKELLEAIDATKDS